ncbi:hypothetical protein BC936DRAFT_142210 [Jimgerdemannia flammicorona]|uniref:Uncharacterized protein n=1 Tax=Jimgerdemannia flammicorona TaxID=994334 RepID=A0A433A0N9_9FUNG|nr:hypothetical protein BC936DRAFT_142210 [Jimgerdemannia flammicorona]
MIFLQSTIVEKLTRSRGIDIDYVLQLKDLLVANNLTQIEEDYISCPLGWGSRTGELHGQNCVLVYQAMQPIIGSDMGLSKVEFDKQVVKLVNSYKEYKTWHKAPYVYGRKPL